MYQTGASHADSPDDHDERDEDSRTKALEQDVGQRLEDGVGNEEDRERGIVGAVRQVEVSQQTIDLRISDVGSVQEADQVEEREPRDELEVEFANEYFVLSYISLVQIRSTLYRKTYNVRFLIGAEVRVWVGRQIFNV